MKSKIKLVDLLKQDFENLLLHDIDEANKNLEAMSSINQCLIEQLKANKSLLKTTQELLESTKQDLNSTKALYQDLKLLYDAGVKNDILKKM